MKMPSAMIRYTPVEADFASFTGYSCGERDGAAVTVARVAGFQVLKPSRGLETYTRIVGLDGQSLGLAYESVSVLEYRLNRSLAEWNEWNATVEAKGVRL